MLFQRTFTKSYATELRRQAKNNERLKRYGETEFEYDKSETVFIPGLKNPTGLLDRLKPTPDQDCDSAIALYEAYQGMTPVQAADETLWVYIAHVDLFSYMQARYNKVKELGFRDGNYILRHWFTVEKWKVLYTVGALWWLVHLTIDPDSPNDKYKYTRRTFRNTGYRTNFLEYTLGRHKEAVFGYYDFLDNNPDIEKEHFKRRNRFITRYLNMLGGFKLLCTLPRTFFFDELTRIKDQILAIRSDTSEKNNSDTDDAQTEDFL